jgi:hypothetical protein
VKKLKAFPKPSHQQPLSPNGVCEWASILDLFHHDVHDTTQDDIRESSDASREIWARCMHLSESQWIGLLATLIGNTYHDDARLTYDRPGVARVGR